MRPSSCRRGWETYWCAGAGVVGSSQAELDAEVAVLEGFLSRWEPRSDPAGNGFFLASSAGGVYAGASGPPFTEHTEPARDLAVRPREAAL